MLETAEECCWYSEDCPEEPDERDVYRMWPGSWDVLFISAEIPLAVLNEQMEGEEQQCQRQEEQEAIVEKPEEIF